jgi:hypothetical protein
MGTLHPNEELYEDVISLEPLNCGRAKTTVVRAMRFSKIAGGIRARRKVTQKRAIARALTAHTSHLAEPEARGVAAIFNSLLSSEVWLTMTETWGMTTDQASAAGLFDAIARIHESGSSEAALAYRRRRDIAGTPRVAVVVQAMVRADRSGVMFTRNLISGRDERVIEASWGLGESVVAGLVTPDFYRMDRDGTVLEQRAGKKDRQIAFDPAGGTKELPVEPARQDLLCLEAVSLTQLHELACRCERVWSNEGAPQDLEWAFEGSTLYLLQRRAVTAQGR